MSEDGDPVGGSGIVSYGAYIPTTRLQRTAIAEAVGWAIPSVKALARGERAVANWDEDSITMAVEAGRDCLQGISRDSIGSVVLATTTAPFADRSNSGVIMDALNLHDSIRNQDATGSRRAATSALMDALGLQNQGQHQLLLAADCREAKPGSVQEMAYGHAAAAVLLGSDEPVAVPVAMTSLHRDLIDQYRASDAEHDYTLEERWLREEGYLKIVPDAIYQVLEGSGVAPEDIDYFILPTTKAMATRIAKMTGLNKAEITDTLSDRVGDSGTATSLLMLCTVLEQASPEQSILLSGFGQGVDMVLLKTTEHITSRQTGRGVARVLANGSSDDNYIRFLSRRQQLALDFGIRSERDNRTAMAAFYRKRKTISGFTGGRCTACGTLQYPPSRVCVECSALNTQEEASFAELDGQIKSFTEDWQAYTPCPPLIYGNVTFPDGGNVMMEFADFNKGEAEVGKAVRMVFRIKDFDHDRHFRRYFWKAMAKPEAIGNG